ncbi:predicted MFS family arabinose efflux permease [Ureibacillus xyleni]|uniref:Predicted MFS family arabinose efflux permease n=1 Tax=Ureibacillus xyleni TaxID=614648 RepID=A0A285TGX7_9BACL|nr:MFS transporter [Ureibacillus xyleni]SOC19624.1 predicted MFS family arabinose efflux permease [Ureibacillus xyleni]
MNNQIFTKRFMSLFSMNLAVFIVFYGLITTLPLYAIGSLGQAEDDAGLLVTIFLLSAIIVRPFSGRLLDIFGKKKMLMISLVFYLICTVLYLFNLPFHVLLVLRFFHGIWFSIITTAGGALAADIVPKNRKGAGLGYYNMSTNLGVVIGPFIGLFLIQYTTYNVLFTVMSIGVLIGGVLASTIKTNDLEVPEAIDKSFKFTFNDLFEKKALPIALIACFVGISYASILSFLSIYAEQQNLLKVASLFYIVFAASMLITRPFTGKLYDQKGSQYVIIPGFVLYILGIFCIAYTNGSSTMFLLAAVLVGIGYGALTTSLQSRAIQSTAHARSGYATATYFTLYDLGIAIGSYLLGMLAMKLNYETLYIISGLLLIATGILYISMFRMKQKRALVITRLEN